MMTAIKIRYLVKSNDRDRGKYISETSRLNQHEVRSFRARCLELREEVKVLQHSVEDFFPTEVTKFTFSR
jgi:uncharacterized protein YlxW (UPF0749 family)